MLRYAKDGSATGFESFFSGHSVFWTQGWSPMDWCCEDCVRCFFAWVCFLYSVYGRFSACRQCFEVKPNQKCFCFFIFFPIEASIMVLFWLAAHAAGLLNFGSFLLRLRFLSGLAEIVSSDFSANVCKWHFFLHGIVETCWNCWHWSLC